ncbi:MAG: hypothetical protein AB8H79_02800 [Myxococcota bacterium]
MTLFEDRVEVSGRRAGPLGTLLLWAAWGLRWSLVVATILVVVPTTSGLSIRLGPEWLLWTPILALVLVGPGFLLIQMLAWRLFQPRVREVLPWDRVRSLWSDNRVIFIELNSPVGVLRGQIRPRSAGSRGMRALMAGIRGGYMPAETGNIRRRGRSIWLDRAVQLAALSLLGVGVWAVRQPLTDLLVYWNEDTVVLVPARMSDAAWEARRKAPCVAQGGGDARVFNKRAGDRLTWQVQGSMRDLRLAHVRWRAGSSRLELHRDVLPASGDEPKFFPGPLFVGLSLLVDSADWSAVSTSLARGSLDGLEAVLCNGQIRSLDVTKVAAPPPAGLSVERQDSDLIIRSTAPDSRMLLLPVRRRIQAGNPWFHTCELPLHNERLNLADVREVRTYPEFFGGREDEARVYAIQRRDRRRLAQLEQAGADVPCAVIDSLAWAGILREPIVLGPAAGPVLDRARDAALAEPMTHMGEDARRALERISERYRAVVTEVGATGSNEHDAVNEGFLAAVPWGELLDRVSGKNSLPLLERTRQSLSGADPSGQAGEAFLIRFAEEFLTRVPTTQSQWDDRVTIAESWLAVHAGTQWTVAELTIRVPDEQTAGYYQIIGRFMLSDVAAAVEREVSNATLPSLSATWVELRLKRHSILIDVKKSSPRKAVDAWFAGDFEYVADRGLSKLAEMVTNEKAAFEAAKSASYRLQTPPPSVPQPVHYSRVRRNGSEFGWVALFAETLVRPRFRLTQGRANHGLPNDWRLATSGSYVTDNKRTSGLAVIDGRPVNFLLSTKMEGVVITHENGVLLGDLRDGTRLPGIGRVLRPMRSLSDFRALLDWLRDHRASAFQTHLLVSEAGLAIDETKASPTQRERRLLATGTRNGVSQVAIIDIPGSNRQSLCEAALSAMALLTTDPAKGGPGWTVTGIANLDVGAYDILVARDAAGRPVYSGPKTLGQAHNLLSFEIK